MSWLHWLFPPPTHGAAVAQRLRRAKPQPIARTSAGGVVCIAGMVEPLDGTIVAPLTGRACVFWAVTLREVWFNLTTFDLADRDQGVPFLLVDGTGRARVIPDGARVALHCRSELRALAPSTKWGAAEPPVMAAHERALFDAMGVRIAETSRVRFLEYIVEPGMSILLRGHGESEPDSQAAEVGYREVPSRIVVASAKRAPLLIGHD